MQKRVVLFLAISLALILFFFVKNLSGDLRQNNPENHAIKDERIVTKVIDGDTLVVSGGDTIRLLGIDSDERGYPCYSDAKKHLENLTLNRQVILESGIENKDQYGRYLRYILIESDSTNINVQMVKEGMAVARILEEDKYSQSIREAEQFAIQNKIGCKWSQ